MSYLTNQILRGAETIRKNSMTTTDTPVPISDRNERCPNCEARLSDRPEDKGKVTWMCFSWRGARVYQSYLCREITRRVKAEAEVERLREWVRSEWPGDQAEEIIKNCKK